MTCALPVYPERRRFDNVRVDGALRQPFHVFQFERFFVNTSAKTRPMILRLASGSFSPASAVGSDLLPVREDNVRTKWS